MSKHLIELDAKNETKYRENLSKAYKEIDKLTKDVTAELNQSVASIVFHDAYPVSYTHLTLPTIYSV